MNYYSRLLRLVLVALISLQCSGWCSAGESGSRWIVLYKDSRRKDAAVVRRAAKVRRDFRIIPAFAADLDESAVAELRKDPDVASVEPDAVRHLCGSRTVAYEPLGAVPWQVVPYGVDMLHARDVWAYTRGGGVRIADLDTGIDLTHPDVPAVVSYATFTDAAVQDSSIGHGTHTAGTLASPDNGLGVVGVAPQAQLLVGRVFDSSGNAYDSDIVEGVQWAVSSGAKVINMSFGGSDYDSALELACNNAAAAGVVLVAAAGNDNTSTPSYPAAFSSVISVAAVDQFKQRASFSDYGSTISLCAPGVSVLSCVPRGSGSYSAANWNGTDRVTASMTGSAYGTVAGSVVYCGLGNASDFPSGMSGKIAHVRRGTLTFATKVSNALAAGAAGVIISNNTSGMISGTLGSSSSLVVVTVSQADGDNLQANSGVTGSITNQQAADYAQWDGTSMSTPHVAGVAALLAAARNGNITPSEVKSILQSTAVDLGTTGRDDYYGYGLVNIRAAFDATIPLISSLAASPTFVEAGEAVSVSVQPTISTGISSITANGVVLSGSGGVWSGSITASSVMGSHSIDVVLTDSWGNTRTGAASYKTARVVGTNGRALLDGATTTGLGNFIFVVWGKASEVTSSGFVLNDGSPYSVTVSAPGHAVTSGQFVRVKGVLQKLLGAASIVTTPAKITVLR